MNVVIVLRMNLGTINYYYNVMSYLLVLPINMKHYFYQPLRCTAHLYNNVYQLCTSYLEYKLPAVQVTSSISYP